jgi:hypothetical protein
MVKINTFSAEWWSGPTSADRQGQNTIPYALGSKGKGAEGLSPRAPLKEVASSLQTNGFYRGEKLHKRGYVRKKYMYCI